MTELDKELLKIEAAYLIENYGMSYGQVARSIPFSSTFRRAVSRNSGMQMG